MRDALHWPARAYWITIADLEPRRVVLSGRDRWALEWLMRAGNVGCTAMECAGVRLSAAIFNLRDAGVEIETVYESHRGAFPGRHGRYVLRSSVSPIGEVRA